MTTESAATIDSKHNQPDTLRTGDDVDAHLRTQYSGLLFRAQELLAAEARMPAQIADADTDAKFTEFVKTIQAAGKALDSARTGEKAPYDVEASRVHSFFRRPMDALTALKSRVEAKMTTYKRAVADAERKERERLAAEARAEEDRKRAEAAAAETAAREAEANAARKRNAETKAAAEAEAAKLRAEADERAKAEAVAAEARAKAETKAAAPAAELSRARGHHGGISSLRTVWTFRDLDRTGLDLEKLRAHIPHDALEMALRSFIKSGGREIRGAVIFQDEQVTTR